MPDRLATILAPSAAAGPAGTLQSTPGLYAPATASSPGATLQNLVTSRAPAAAAGPAGVLRAMPGAFVAVPLASWGGGAVRMGEKVAEVQIPVDGTAVAASIKAVLNSIAGPMLAASPLLSAGTYFLRYERGGIDFNAATANGWDIGVNGRLYYRGGASNSVADYGDLEGANQAAVEAAYANRWIADLTLTAAGLIHLGHAESGDNTDNLAGTSLPTIGIYRAAA